MNRVRLLNLFQKRSLRMESDLKQTLLQVGSLLLKHEVNYLIVGGAAVGLHGHFRHSSNEDGTLRAKPDLDIWYQPTYNNYFRLLRVIKDLGYDTTRFDQEQAPNPRSSYFKFDFGDFTLDFLPELVADLNFSEAYARRETIFVSDVPLYLMAILDLMADKRAAARKKDLEDLAALRKKKGGQQP